MIVVSLSAVALIGACGPEKVGRSGFLGDYDQLKPSKEHNDADFYQNPDRGLAEFDKFLIDPIVLHFAPQAKGVAIDADKLDKVVDYAREQLTEGLSKNYQVVEESGPGVLRLRIALTDIKKSVGLLNIHPATKLTGAGLGGASFEAEAVDSKSGERIAAIVESRPGDVISLEGLGEFDHAKQVIRFWVDRFVKRLDEAHGIEG
jgi:hypothetical protein